VIDYLNGLLGRLFTSHSPPGLTASQIGFNAPDDNWRMHVEGMPGIALNVYLTELHEDLTRRSHERVHHTGAASIVEQTRVPARLNCRYLLSAWSPLTVNALTDPAVAEAVLLYQVTQLLMDTIPLDAAAIYPPGALPAGFPPEMLDPPLPAVVVPAAPFDKLPDFWARMDTVWKPVVELIVTLPVPHGVQQAGPPVTTLFAEYRTTSDPALEDRIAIGGVVRLTPTEDPVPDAWVRLVELDWMVTANAAGQFVFTGLARGAYTLEAGAAGHATTSRSVSVPSLSGEYDLHLA
jgi:hypothetical protein